MEQLVEPESPEQRVVPKLFVEQLVEPESPEQRVVPKLLVVQLKLPPKESCIDTTEVATTIAETAPKPLKAKTTEPNVSKIRLRKRIFLSNYLQVYLWRKESYLHLKEFP